MDLAGLCLKAGVKNLSTVFLMTDAQVADEKFLVLINDLLASGKRLLVPEYLIDFPWSWSHLVQGQRNEIGHRNEGENWYSEELVHQGFSRIDAGPADLAFSLTFHGKTDNNLGALLAGLDLRIKKTGWRPAVPSPKPSQSETRMRAVFQVG